MELRSKWVYKKIKWMSYRFQPIISAIEDDQRQRELLGIQETEGNDDCPSLIQTHMARQSKQTDY